jgi:hypothetical protein
MNPMKLIDGHKTQIGATASLVVGLAIARGWITADVGQLILAVLTIWTGVAIAHHQAKGVK